MKSNGFFNCITPLWALFALCGPAGATVITANNAGSTLATAQVIPGGSGTLSDITGFIDNDTNQVELFKIFLIDGVEFSATTVSNTSNFFDTELFLLNSVGTGVYENNDDLNAGGTQSTLPTGDTFSPTTSGFYYLGITSNGIDPFSSGGAIFDIANNPSYLVLGPNGPGGSDPLTGYQGSSTEQGTVAFDIRLTGVSVAGTTAVPEPSYTLLFLLAGIVFVFLKRKMLLRSRSLGAVMTLFSISGVLSAQEPATNLGGGLAELRDAYVARTKAEARPGSPQPALTLTKDAATGQYSTDPKLSRVITDSSSRVLVQIFLNGKTPMAEVERQVTQLGGRVDATDTHWRNGVVDAYIPLSIVDTLAKHPGVRSMTLTPKRRVRPTHSVPVPVGTQSATGIGPGNTPMNNLQHTDQANASGITGAGITVAVTSDSYNANGHAASEIAQGLLPAAGVTVISDNSSGSDEGNAMLQLVHDVAPGAKLCFSNYFGGETGFANAIRTMRTNTACSADIIADDLGFGDEPFFSDGQIAEAVQEVVTNTTLAGAPAGLTGKNVSYFVYGGNDGNNGLQTTFSLTTDSAARALSPVLLSHINSSFSGGGFQNFGTAASPSVSLPVTFPAGNNGSLTLFWDDLFNDNAVTTDYNLFIVDSSGNIVASSTANNISSDQPLESISITNTSGSDMHLFLVISRTSAGTHAANRLLLLSNDDGNNGVVLPAGITGPTVFGHSSAAAANAVAAVTFGQQASAPFYPFVAPYNSRGPVTIAFDANNNRLAAALVRKKPDMAAIVNNTVANFPDPTDPFGGTSAAAPANAGIAALMLQKAGGPGSLTPAQLKSYMLASGPSRDVDVFTATASTAGLKVISTDTVPVFTDASAPPPSFDTTFAVTFTSAGKQLNSLKIDLTSVGGSFITDPDQGGFALKTDSMSPGVTLASSAVSGTNNAILTLNFTGFVTGDQFTFDLGATAPYPNPLTLVIGGFSDLITGVPVTATLSSGPNLTAPFVNVIGKAWTQYDGFGIINALTALSKIQ